MVGVDGVAAAFASLTGVSVAVTVVVVVSVGVGVGVGVALDVLDDELLDTRASYSNCIVDPWTVSAFVESIRFVFVLVAEYCMAAKTPLFANV